MLVAILPMLIGYTMDYIFGDPNSKYHPICLIGSLISYLENILIGEGEKSQSPKEDREIVFFKGGIMAIIVMSVSFFLPLIILKLAYSLSLILGVALDGVLCFFILARQSLNDQSKRVRNYLIKSDIPNARKAVSMIVGRDTEGLDEEEISRATIETVAENTNDGVIAPMLFMMIGYIIGRNGLGVALGMLYKSVNTLDSMVGYKNNRYKDFGRLSARLDDAFGFIPARISAVLIILSSAILDLDTKNAKYIFKRDRFNHDSPNSAQSESAVAGALGIMLGGDSYYNGILSHKKTIGDSINLISYEDITLSLKLLNVSSAIFLYFGVFLIFVFNFSI